MKKLIVEMPDAVHKELKLASIEDELTVKDAVNELIWSKLLSRLKEKGIIAQITNDNVKLEEIGDRITLLRTARHSEHIPA